MSNFHCLVNNYKITCNRKIFGTSYITIHTDKYHNFISQQSVYQKYKFNNTKTEKLMLIN